MIFAAFNIGFNAVKPGSRYFKSWCLAAGDRVPSRNAIMSPMIFKNKTFMVQTRTVKPKRGNEELGVDYWYSIIDYLQSMDLPDKKEDPFD